MSRFYIFCRFWTGFTPKFPVHQFNDLHEREIVQAVYDAVKHAFENDPILSRTFTIRARPTPAADAKRLYPVSSPSMLAPSIPNRTSRSPTAAQQRLLPMSPSAPAFFPKVLDLTTTAGFTTAAKEIGWAPSGVPTSPAPQLETAQRRHLLVAVESEQVAKKMVEALEYRRNHVTRFGYFAAKDIPEAERPHRELELDDLHAALTDNTYPIGDDSITPGLAMLHFSVEGSTPRDSRRPMPKNVINLARYSGRLVEKILQSAASEDVQIGPEEPAKAVGAINESAATTVTAMPSEATPASPIGGVMTPPISPPTAHTTAGEMTSKAGQKVELDPVAAACGLKVKYPELSDRKIADQVGVSPSTLSRSEEYQRAKAASVNAPPPRGTKDGQIGEIEATDER